jgi:hypothetical protein
MGRDMGMGMDTDGGRHSTLVIAAPRDSTGTRIACRFSIPVSAENTSCAATAQAAPTEAKDVSDDNALQLLPLSPRRLTTTTAATTTTTMMTTTTMATRA